MHHGALDGQIFTYPVKALARRVAHIRVNTFDGMKLLCAYWESNGRVNFTERGMLFHIKFAAKN